MKCRIQGIVLLLLPVFMSSCDNGNQLKTEVVFSPSDSTETVSRIIDSLRAEMDYQWFMKESNSGIICYDSPSFSPKIKIVITRANDIIAGNTRNPKSVSELVVKFYSANRYNDVSNNFPRYTEIKKKDILLKILELEEELETEKKKQNLSQEIIDFKQMLIDEWKNKLRILSVLATTEMREPEYSAGVEFMYPDECTINEQILDSILFGFYKMREMDSKIYFDESYARIFWKATVRGDSSATSRLETFKTLHPVRILDYGKSRYRPKGEIPSPPFID